jgi:hypothetical protein
MNGIYVLHDDMAHLTRVEIHEGEAWPDGEPRSSLDIMVEWPRERFGKKRTAEVRWPGTSDHRIELAESMSRALETAACLARQMDRGSLPQTIGRRIDPGTARRELGHV